MIKVVASLLTAALILPAPAARGTQAKKRLTPELISQPGVFTSRGITDTDWRPGTDQITYIRTTGSGKEAASTLYLYDATTGKESVLYRPEGDKDKLTPFGYQWSPNRESILLRGSNGLWLLDVATGHKRRLTDHADAEGPTFAPAGDRLAYVRGNNLYTLDLATGVERQLTTDGSETVFNGKLDWVYEEELELRSTVPPYQWSPDGRSIAYLRLDDAPVPKYPVTDYLADHVALSEERFPQAGDANPTASFHVVSVEASRSEDRTFPLNDPKAEYIAPRSAWTPDSKNICVVTLNRDQNEETVHLWNPVTGEHRVLLTEKDATWINAIDPPAFLKDGQRFLWLSERDGWLHLYLYRMDGRLVQPLTRGPWEIDHPIFSNAPAIEVDEKTGWVYYLSTQVDPRERHLFRVRLDGGAPERLSDDAGVHSLDLSPTGHYLLDTFSNLATPREARLLKSDGAAAATLSKPENHTGDYALGKTELVEVRASDGAVLYASLLKPAAFDPARRYPVIVRVYGGPLFQFVQNEWSLGWSDEVLDQLLAQEGFLIWTLDNRGSGAGDTPGSRSSTSTWVNTSLPTNWRASTT